MRHGPHEFSNPEVLKALGKDWLGQTEEFPKKPTDAAKKTDDAEPAAAG